MRDFEYDTGRDYPATGNRTLPEQVPMLDEIVNHINNSAVHASLVLDRLSSLGNRAFGSQPDVGEAADKVGISQEGAVGRVFLALGNLDRILAALEHAENRVHGLA